MKDGPLQLSKMRRSHTFSIGEFYHLYNRGTDKREIFLDVHDYHRFILLLYFCNTRNPINLGEEFRRGRSFAELFEMNRGEPLVAIGAWCLMPNHIHLLVKEIFEGGMTIFMRKVMTGYSMYFNIKYKRTGNLFQGRFKSEHAETDVYLKYLFSYIHLNPIKLIPGESEWKNSGIKNIDEAKDFLSKYEYSSLASYINDSHRYKKIIAKDQFPEYFPTGEVIWNEILEWLTLISSAEDGPLQKK